MININHDFMSQSSQREDSLELANYEIMKISQSLIKGNIWTFRSIFRNFVSRGSRRESIEDS